MLEAGTQTNNRLGTLASIINKSKQNRESSSSNSSLKGGCAQGSKFAGTINFDHDLYLCISKRAHTLDFHIPLHGILCCTQLCISKCARALDFHVPSLHLSLGFHR